MLIAKTVFLLERGQTDKQTDATERRTHAGGYSYAGVGRPNNATEQKNTDVVVRQFMSILVMSYSNDLHLDTVRYKVMSVGKLHHFCQRTLKNC